MAASESSKENDFNFISDVEGVLNYISGDNCIDELLDAIFPQKGSIEAAIIEFLSKCSFPPEVHNACDVIIALKQGNDNMCYFLARLYAKLMDIIDPERNKDLLIRLNRSLFWQMYGISVKKCLGVGHSKEQIPDTVLLSVLPADMNANQIDANMKTLLSFNSDAQKYSFKQTPDLGFYLHPIRSRNKSPKTKKKNIRRVEKRAKRIIQVYGLKHEGAMFGKGRHHVPKQFADGVIKLYINNNLNP